MLNEIKDKQMKKMRDIWADVFGNNVVDVNYKELSDDLKQQVDQFLSDFNEVMSNISKVSSDLKTAVGLLEGSTQNNKIDSTIITAAEKYISPVTKRALDALRNNPTIYVSLVTEYVDGIDFKELQIDNRYAREQAVKENKSNIIAYSQLLNAALQDLLQDYERYLELLKEESNPLEDRSFDIISDMLNGMFEIPDRSLAGKDKSLQFYIDYIKQQREVRQKYLLRKGKFREDTAPRLLAPYQCRIGASTFYVPPTNITVSQTFKTMSLGGGAIRQSNSMKTNLGHSETVVSMTLYFPNHQEIWGFKGDKAPFNLLNWDPEPVIRKDLPKDYLENLTSKQVPDEVIDKYLSSLRGLITQFKYAPFLPVKNVYLNKTYDITAVAMKNMTISTMENFPFVLVVNLEMYKFNYNVYLPMIEDFDQAIHWGKYRQYIGKAVARLDSMVNQGFLVEKSDTSKLSAGSIVDVNSLPVIAEYEGDIIPKLSKADDLSNGSRFEIYYPVTTPNKIFAADTTEFTQPGENEVMSEEDWSILTDLLGIRIVKKPEYSPHNYSKGYKPTSELKILNEWLKINREFNDMTSKSLKKFIDDQMKKNNLTSGDPRYNAQTTSLEAAWFLKVYELYISNNPVLADRVKTLDAIRKRVIKEWKVPMDKLSIDWTKCVVTGLNVSMSNNFASLQVQMQPEPTYQHLGGGDGTLNISMIVIGEDNLINFRRLFDHINGLARLEHKHGVLGFLGIKNAITAVCGMKYLLPLSFETETIPNFPHVYRVNLSFIDFDVMQQQREQLSADQQRRMLQTFGSKRNPFLRLKQNWSAICAYPDMPLQMRDEDGNIITHLDPDWYFRSFRTDDNDMFSWRNELDLVTYLKQYTALKDDLELLDSIEVDPTDPKKVEQAKQYREYLQSELNNFNDAVKEIIDNQSNNIKLPTGWVMSDGKLSYDDTGLELVNEEPEMTTVLGTFSDDPKTSTIMSMFKNGTFKLGIQKVITGSDGKSKVSREYIANQMTTFSEDLASANLKGSKWLDSTTSISTHQQEYVDGDDNPNRQFQRMLEDFDYRNLRGRMVKAFPTYMLWFIDEFGKFAGIRLFDNYYSLNSVIDFSVLQSEDCIGDTLVMRLSNVYGKLTTPYLDQLIAENDPLYNSPVGKLINVAQNRTRNLVQGLVDNSDIIEINSVRLKPGVRIHLRMGYGANPNSLQVVFNGVITEVESGEIMTIVAQSDAVELTAMVNTSNEKGHSGKLDGGVNTGFWMSEPRDLMVRLLSMGSSKFKEFVATGTKGMIFSDNRFGIRHFGSILYEALNDTEKTAHLQQRAAITQTITASSGGTLSRGTRTDVGATQFAPAIGEFAKNVADFNVPGILGNTFNLDNVKLMAAFFSNSMASRDFEIFKRNIYPGNGTGIAQFMGGDQIDAGVTISVANAQIKKRAEEASSTNPNSKLTQQQLSQREVKQDQIEQILKDYRASQNTFNYQDSQLTNTNISYAPIGTVSLGEGVLDASGLEVMTNEKILSMLKSPDINRQLIDIPYTVEDEYKGKGLFRSLWGLVNKAWDLGVEGALFLTPLGIGLQIGSVLDPTGVLKGIKGALKNPISTTKKIANSNLGRLLGFGSAMPDDDLAGYDEVSFRAQTYMKTVWDLFKVCAALLPNYIVAVRPFEDRSTVFYGKPHWLYTSGVIPLTTGIVNDPSAKPILNGDSDLALTSLFNLARRTEDSNAARIKDLVEKANAIDTRSILGFSSTTDIPDPYNIGGYGGTDAPLSSAEDRKNMVYATINQNSDDKDNKFGNSEFGKFLIKAFAEEPTVVSTEFSKLLERVSVGDFQVLLTKMYSAAKSKNFIEDQMDTAKASSIFKNFSPLIKESLNRFDAEEFKKLDIENFKALLIRTFESYRNDLESNITKFNNSTEMGEKFWQDLRLNNETVRQQLKTLGWNGLDNDNPLKELAIKDPITFAYRFGWKLTYAPAWIDPTTGYGVDKVGELARKYWDEKFSSTVDAAHPDRDWGEAKDIWQDFKNEFPKLPEVREEFIIRYGTAEDVGTSGINDQTVVNLDRKFNFVLDLFMRFLWQDPFNRAWLVITADGKPRGTFSHTDRRWAWYAPLEAWKTFLTDKVSIANATVNPLETITAPNTRGYMEQNQKAGKDPHHWAYNAAKSVGDWWNNNVGKLLSVLQDTMTGLVASIRNSIGQLASALSFTGEMQKQANMLNSVLMDSIYYQAGVDDPKDPKYILRLVDNPFTREYGEPVVEIREPFQRIHFISSYENILYNQIKENFTEVVTTVTAVSDGKYPVTVHFDKGIPPDRQVEKTVETGLLWDNALGSGITGIFQPLLHPLETARSFAKTFTGSSDQLSARRVGLYHLKESLKDIYGGEITVLGDADIRPFDLLYIADVYERIYGLVEVEQVVHHFTPETGFVTSITPNALVSVNDPVRWTMMTYLYHKMTSYNIRSDVRALMNIKADRAASLANAEILTPDNVYKYFGSQLQGSVQWTQGNTAIIRDIGAMYTGGGIKAIRAREKAMSDAIKTEFVGKIATTVAVGTATLGAAVLSGGTAATIVGGIGLGAGDLLWSGYDYVKNNLLDQHGCYIQYLNKDGMPMDAGLSYVQGVAAGSNHTLTLFPNALGIPTTKVNTYENGKFRITTNDILSSLGWTEYESISAFRDTSIFVNRTNSQILKTANPNQEGLLNSEDFLVIKCRVLDVGVLNTETGIYEKSPDPGTGKVERGVIDGDTIRVQVIEANSFYSPGQVLKIRLAGIDTYETRYKELKGDTVDFGQTNVRFDDLGRMARDYLIRKFYNESDKYIAIRVSTKIGEMKDKYDRLLGVVFCNTSTDDLNNENRLKQLHYFASKNPPVSIDSYMSNGRPYTLNWELVMAGLANVYMNDIIWDNNWRQEATGP